MTTRLSWPRIFALCSASAAVDLMLSVEGAYFVPAIYDSGVSREYGSLFLASSPLLVLMFQNYMGSASDRCSCQWGRRKPFILALTVSILLGLILFPLAGDLASLAETYRVRRWLLIVLILSSIILTDFNLSSVQVPLRALLLDVLPQEQVVTGNIIFPALAMLGAAVGYGMGSVNWASILSVSNNLSMQVKVICGLSILMMVVLTLITLCSTKERVAQQNVELQQVICDITPTVQNSKVDNCDHSTQANDPDLSGLQQYLRNYLSYDNMTVLPYGGHITTSTVGHTGDSNNCCTVYNSVVDFVCFVRYISFSTAMLCIATFFAVITLVTQMIFFTHYVGDVIFDGDVFAPENSTAYKNYVEGVKKGSMILAVSSVSGFVFLLFLGPAVKCIGLRPLYVLPCVLSMLQSGILVINHNLVAAIVLSPAIYIMVVQYLTFPHILISMYQAKGLLMKKSWPHSDANLMGRSCSLVLIAVQVAKVITLTVNGPLMMAYGSAVSVMIFTCICSFLGALVACFVTVPPISNRKKHNMKTQSPMNKCKPEYEMKDLTFESTAVKVVK